MDVPQIYSRPPTLRCNSAEMICYNTPSWERPGCKLSHQRVDYGAFALRSAVPNKGTNLCRLNTRGVVIKERSIRFCFVQYTNKLINNFERRLTKFETHIFSGSDSVHMSKASVDIFYKQVDLKFWKTPYEVWKSHFLRWDSVHMLNGSVDILIFLKWKCYF